MRVLDGVAATGRTMDVCVVGALGLGRRLTVVCCSGSNRKGGGMEDYKAVSSESRKSAGRQAGRQLVQRVWALGSGKTW